MELLRLLLALQDRGTGASPFAGMPQPVADGDSLRGKEAKLQFHCFDERAGGYFYMCMKCCIIQRGRIDPQ
jgi:hypothetical protein